MDISLLREREINSALSVTELNAFIKKLLDTNKTLSSVSVTGEISNLKDHGSGHLYFSLKDTGAQIKAVMFRFQRSRLKFIPEDGMKVTVHGSVSIYEQTGSVQIYVNSMEPDGIGALYMAYEQLKTKLASEGLFDDQYKKPIPIYPRRIGVITSPSGAAVRDVINVTKRRFPLADIILYPSKVQGEGAAENVKRGIEYFNETKSVDVIIAGRGGGSIEDLWAFNEEITARAIFKSEIPIISAVGHEIDFTIADFVADLRAPTPSAAAELAVPSAEEVFNSLKISEARMKNALITSLKRKKDKLTYVSKMLSAERFSDKLNQMMIMLDTKSEHRVKIMENILSQKGKGLAVLAAKLDSMSPLKVLSRGYGIVTDYRDKVIKSVSELDKGMRVGIKFADGEAKARIEEVSE